MKVQFDENTIMFPDGYQQVNYGDIQKKELVYEKSTDNSKNRITILKMPIEETVDFDNIDKLIEEIHGILKSNQGLIELNSGVGVNESRYIYSLIKDIDTEIGGATYILDMNIKLDMLIYKIYGEFKETGITGKRDNIGLQLALTYKLIGNEESPFDGWNKDPYDESYNKGILKNMSEGQGMDYLFQEHPLSQARELIYAIINNKLLTYNINLTTMSKEKFVDYLFDGEVSRRYPNNNSKNPLVDLKNNFGKAIGDLGKSTGSIVGDIGKNAGNVANTVGKKAGEIAEGMGNGANSFATGFGKNVGNFAQNITKGANNVTSNVSKNVGNVVKDVAKSTGDAASVAGKTMNNVDFLSSNFRKKSIEDFNNAVKKYSDVSSALGESSQELYTQRQRALKVIEEVKNHINMIANTPKEFDTRLEKVEYEVEDFKSKQKEIHNAEVEAKTASNGTGVGVTLSSLGLAVATLGPKAAMGIATTFGVASTGAEISSLSGAAATNAALAWLGGGTLATGGGGVSAGSALLALAGPIGWTIAGVCLTVSIGSGIFANYKNKQAADEAILERKKVEVMIRSLDEIKAEISELISATQKQIIGVSESNQNVKSTDYKGFSEDEKLQAGILVNSTLTLAQLINKEVKQDDFTTAS